MRQLQKMPVWVWLCIISFVPLLSLFTPGLPITHDGPDHVARIANFYASLKEGILIPRWAANLNWGYGHPILMFLYPFPSYAGSFFHALGFSFVDSTKLVFAVSFIASTLAMYLWLRRIFHPAGAVVGSLLYSFAPYRFVDLYVRGAIGEHVAFIFPPLVCYFLHRLSLEKSNMNNVLFAAGLSGSMAGLILAHNAIALMFIPIFALYAIYILRYEAIQRILFFFLSNIAILFGFGLSAFFWIPAFFEGKYTLRDIVTAGEVLTRFVPWNHFVYSPWSFGGTDLLSKSLGLAGILTVMVSLFGIGKLHMKKERILLYGSVFLLVVTLVLMTELSKPVWSAITLLQKFQFPWRFLSVTTFLVAVIGSIVTDVAEKQVSKHTFRILSIGIFVLIILPTVGMWHPRAYEVRSESIFKEVYRSTTDTGESSPIWSVRFMEHTPSAAVEIIQGEATVSQGVRTTTTREYAVSAATESRILENTLYFPGWTVYVDGSKTDIQFQDPQYRGLMTFMVPQGQHTVLIRFEDTKIRKVAQYISLISALALAIALGCALIWKRKK